MHLKRIALPGLLALALSLILILNPKSILARQTAFDKANNKGSKFFVATGVASYYANRFNGKTTANGEQFNMHDFTAAHRSLPFGSIVRVTNLKNGKIVFVKINDRGPYVSNRIIDLSKAAARQLDMIDRGISNVKIEAYN